MRRYLLNFATIISLTHAYPSGSYCARDGDTKIEIHVKSTTNLDARVGDAECKNVEYVFTSKDNFSISKQCLNLHDDLSYISSTNRFYFKDVELRQEICHTTPHAKDKLFEPSNDVPIRLPSLNIERHSVATAGCSHAGDFASQFHIAFSNLVSASCVFSGQPYHCAVTRFSRDYLVPQDNSSSVPFCDGCPSNETLLYDHCKNHPQYVDVGQLVDYPRRACGQNPITKDPCIDDPKNLYKSRAYVFHPTHDRCYLPGSVANTAALYGMLMTDPANHLKFVDNQPFPHTLPKNSTPYFNHSEPANFDGPGECLRFIYQEKFGYDQNLTWAVDPKQENLFLFNQSEFVDDWGVGLQETGMIYIPTKCLPPSMSNSSSAGKTPCKLMFMLGLDFDFARYGESNNIVVVGMQIGGYVDRTRFPNACEVLRGLSDVYGQLGEDYAMQSAYQMRVGGRIVRRLMGMD